MRKRPVVILLMATLCLSQALVAASALPAHPQMLDLVVAIAPLAILLALDVVLARVLDQALERQRQAHAYALGQLLQTSLEDYRREGLRDREAARVAAEQILDELSRARAALAQDDSDSLTRHLSSSLALADATRPASCAHATVAAVLASKERQAAAEGVTLTARVSLPEKLALDDIEVAALFFNLIDNALHECKALGDACGGPDGVQAHVMVRSWVQAGQLFVQVENPCRGDARERQRRAEKTGQDLDRSHGWGTSIVADIARAHGGITEFSQHEAVFSASVLIPLPTAPTAQAEGWQSVP